MQAGSGRESELSMSFRPFGPSLVRNVSKNRRNSNYAMPIEATNFPLRGRRMPCFVILL